MIFGTIKYDGLSMAASVLCTIHCVVFPLVFPLLSLSSWWYFNDSLIELITCFTTAVIGGWAIYKGYKIHQHKKLVIFFLLGILLMFLGNMFPTAKAEIIVKFLASTIVFIVHLYNIKFKKICNKHF